jgi:hypothetical protein
MSAHGGGAHGGTVYNNFRRRRGAGTELIGGQGSLLTYTVSSI